MSGTVRQPVAIRGAPVPRATPPSGLAKPLDIVEQAGGMVVLFVRASIALVTPPFRWRGEFIQESWLVISRCMFPLVVSALVFGFGTAGTAGGNVFSLLGTIDRLGAFYVAASVREFGPYLNGMILAGVAGTAITADLGARKVRDELDALAALGLDPVREIVAPRFLALGILVAFTNLVAVFVGGISGYIASIAYGGHLAGYMATFTSNFSFADLFGTVLKTSGMGAITAVFCCYKGMNVRGGPEGVGRAVNQAVVLSFAGVWIFNYLFTSVLLATFPETQNLH